VGKTRANVHEESRGGVGASVRRSVVVADDKDAVVEREL
jgi:hypothetical protein